MYHEVKKFVYLGSQDTIYKSRESEVTYVVRDNNPRIELELQAMR